MDPFCDLGCPEICERGPIVMLIRIILLYGILILQNDFRENPTIFDPPLKPRSSGVQGLLTYLLRASGPLSARAANGPPHPSILHAVV